MKTTLGLIILPIYPQFENGKEIAYSVKEVDVPKDYTDNIEIGTDGNFTLTNSHTPCNSRKNP